MRLDTTKKKVGKVLGWVGATTVVTMLVGMGFYVHPALGTVFLGTSLMLLGGLLYEGVI